MQIDDLLHRIDEKEGEVARVVEEKEQELMIMQEGMDSTLKELSEMRIVSSYMYFANNRPLATPTKRSTLKSIHSSSTTAKS